MTLDVRAPRDDGERDALSDLLCVCFNSPADGIAVGMERVGADHQRVLMDGASVLGGLWQLPMGQWFGGRSVPMVGIAAVGVEAAARGTGAGDALMASTVRELHARRVPLSCLYPATVNFYRRAGYELAGSRQRIELPLKGLRVRAAPGATLRPGTATDLPEMERCYARSVGAHAGPLDRRDYCWARVRQPRGETARHWLVHEHGELSGYVTLIQKDSPDDIGYDLQLTDVAATTPGAVTTLLSFLSGQRSLSGRAILFGSDRHPLLLGLPEWLVKVSLDLHWMLRVTHAEQALTARGYAPAVSGELEFELADELIPEHAGPLQLSVREGHATVTREPARSGAGRAPMRLDVRGLAALYSGFLTPPELVRMELLQGSSEQLATLGALFAGGTPWMADMF
ncbi:MAG: GNAT family N-acetyltransferase [Planctomycetota bacterium]|nr:MAG: GNAT family N-acetyltransferase [Planctomycetota bacterium]